MAEYKVYIVICKPSQRKTVIQFLKEHGFEVEPTILNDYIIVFDKNPEELLKKAFSGVKTQEIDPDYEYYVDILATVQKHRSIVGLFKQGDPVRVIDKDLPYYGSTGIVEEIQGDVVKVVLSLWGIPHKVELPKKALMRISHKF